MSCLGLDDSKFFVFIYYFLLAPTLPMLLYFIKPLYFVITDRCSADYSNSWYVWLMVEFEQLKSQNIPIRVHFSTIIAFMQSLHHIVSLVFYKVSIIVYYQL